MSTTTSKAVADAVEVSPELMAVYVKTEAVLRKAYGDSPSPQELMRFWLTCATPELIVMEFEEAVLGPEAGRLIPNEEGRYDETSL